uniref:Uncharacterized protein n=1 Tax=Pycnococcus provasolii TaxID=41880 RepID=A0A6U0A655_9CHLO
MFLEKNPRPSHRPPPDPFISKKFKKFLPEHTSRQASFFPSLAFLFLHNREHLSEHFFVRAANPPSWRSSVPEACSTTAKVRTLTYNICLFKFISTGLCCLMIDQRSPEEA